MKALSIIILCSLFSVSSEAQKYITKNGFISFYSHTPLEDIKGDNNQVASVLDGSTGEIVYQVLIKSFHFSKSLMEEHFNENYMESEKYPKATFKGKITNLSSIDFKKPGVYEATVEGDLTIRDVTKKVTSNGTIEVLPEGLTTKAKFNISPEDYNIKIPKVVRDNIAKSVEVTIIMNYTIL